MNDLISAVGDSSVISVGGFILGIIGIILAVVFYLKSRRFSRLHYDTKSFELITDSVSQLPGFAATYRNSPLNNLIASRLILWNSGTNIISASDVAANDPIRIRLSEGTQVLDCRLDAVSSPTNMIQATAGQPLGKEVLISLDYIASRQGCVISFLHTSNSKEAPRLIGTLKGFGSPIFYKPKWYVRILDEASAYMMAILLVIIMKYLDFRWYLLLTGFLLIFPLCYGLAVLLKRLKQRVGKELDKVFQTSFSPSQFY